jgi:hypothetical protein
VRIDRRILKAAETGLKTIPENNMSEYIEAITTPLLPPKGDRIRKWKTYPIKKTFNFTEEYADCLRITGNLSLALEELLIKALKLK